MSPDDKKPNANDPDWWTNPKVWTGSKVWGEINRLRFIEQTAIALYGHMLVQAWDVAREEGHEPPTAAEIADDAYDFAESLANERDRRARLENKP